MNTVALYFLLGLCPTPISPIGAGTCPRRYGPLAMLLPATNALMVHLPFAQWNCGPSPNTQRSRPFGSARLMPPSRVSVRVGVSSRVRTGPSCWTAPAAPEGAGTNPTAMRQAVARTAPNRNGTREPKRMFSPDVALPGEKYRAIWAVPRTGGRGRGGAPRED